MKIGKPIIIMFVSIAVLVMIASPDSSEPKNTDNVSEETSSDTGTPDDENSKTLSDDNTQDNDDKEKLPDTDTPDNKNNETLSDDAQDNENNEPNKQANTEKNISDGRNYINDTLQYDLENGGKARITLTGWGADKEMFDDSPILYVSYTIENTSSEDINVGNSLFTIYADNYSTDPVVFNENSKAVTSARLSPGRKVSGELYADIDPDEASVIEVEVWGSTFVIKDIDAGINEPDAASHEPGANSEFNVEWYKSTPNFASDDGNSLGVIWDDYGNLTFSLSNGTYYDGTSYNYDISHNDDGSPYSYSYHVTDAVTGENNTIVYYPPDSLVSSFGTFTAVQ